jgi:hypothetical protein
LSKGEKRDCPICQKFVEVMELVSNLSRDGWYTQKLSCGHTGRIRIMDAIEEKIEISAEVKSVPIDVNTDKSMQIKPRRIQEVFPASVDIEEMNANT